MRKAPVHHRDLDSDPRHGCWLPDQRRYFGTLWGSEKFTKGIKQGVGFIVIKGKEVPYPAVLLAGLLVWLALSVGVAWVMLRGVT